MNTTNPGPSGPPPTANPYVELVAAAIKSGETAKSEATALMTANAVQQLVNRLNASTADVNALKEQLAKELPKEPSEPLNNPLLVEKLRKQLGRRLKPHQRLLEEAYVCKDVLEGGEIYAAQKGNAKLAEFFHRLGAMFNSPDAAWPRETRKAKPIAAPATAGAN